jgi:hypothetical protein
MDAVYGTTGLFCSSVALLPRRVRVSDYRVFIVNISSKTILGNAFPRVIPVARQLLTCSSDKIRNNYTTVLNQLANRHLIFNKLLLIDQEDDHAELHLHLNSVDLELEQFMKSAEQGCHKCKRNSIEWSLYVGMWILRWWLLSRVLDLMSGKMRNPRNLFRDCQLKGVKDPRLIMVDGLKTEFLVCKQNLKLLEKHGPCFWLKFLKGLVSKVKKKGDSVHATRITGILRRRPLENGGEGLTGPPAKRVVV